MSASSVTGTGQGTSGKFTTKELAILANGPALIAVGTTTSEDLPGNGPYNVDVILPKPLPNSGNYVILVSAESGTASVSNMYDDDELNLTGFQITANAQTTLSYVVFKKGFKPEV